MNDRRARWNERFSRGEEVHAFEPSPPLPLALDHLASTAGARALDVACGAGRHALYLAGRGLRVTAVDWSESGLSLLSAEAARRGLSDRIEIVTADLEAGGFTPEPFAFDLVCDFYFLHRPLFPALRDAVRPGGLFVASIHVDSPEGAASHRFLLAAGELRATVEAWGFEIVHATEGVRGLAETQPLPGKDAPLAPSRGVLAPSASATAEIIARRPR